MVATLAAATAMCEKALAAMPCAGEDGLEFAAPWIAHVASRVTELVAGFCGERVGGYDGAGEPVRRISRSPKFMPPALPRPAR